MSVRILPSFMDLEGFPDLPLNEPMTIADLEALAATRIAPRLESPNLSPWT